METKKQLKEKADQLIGQLINLTFKEISCMIFGKKQKLKEVEKETDRIGKEYEEVMEKLRLLESPSFHSLPDLSITVKNLDRTIQQRDLIQDVQENEMMFCFRTQQLEYARDLIEMANKQINSTTYV